MNTKIVPGYGCLLALALVLAGCGGGDPVAADRYVEPDRLFAAVDANVDAAAGGPSDLREQMLTGWKGHKAHLDGYNQMALLTGKGDSARKEIIYYERTTLQAVRYQDWKAHFIIQPHGWGGMKEQLNAPLLMNLRQDPYERAFHESGMYAPWLGKKMWAFGPAQAIVKKHLASFQEWPPVSTAALANQQNLEGMLEDGGMGR